MTPDSPHYPRNRLSAFFSLSSLILSLALLGGCTNYFFYPMKEWRQTPGDYGYAFDNIMLPMRDGVALNLWYMPKRNDRLKGSVLFFHGNAENISTHVNSVYWLTDAGFDVYLLDYRGYGKSQGVAEINAVIGDIAEVSQWFISRTDEDKYRVVLGQSMGAAMSGYVMSTRSDIASKMSLVLLESGFANYSQVARDVLGQIWLTWAIQYPLSWTISGQYNLEDVIAGISPTPLLLLHGVNDPVVPIEHAHQLMQSAKEPKRLMTYSGGHIAAFSNKDNRKIVVDYIEALPVRMAEVDEPQ